MKMKPNTKQNASSSKEIQATLGSINERLDSIEEALRLILVNMVMAEADDCLGRIGADSSDKATAPPKTAAESAGGATAVAPETGESATDVINYDVILKECRVNKVEVVKAISENSSITQLAAWEMIWQAPITIATYDSYWRAQNLQTALVKLGAEVEIETRKPSRPSSSNSAKCKK